MQHDEQQRARVLAERIHESLENLYEAREEDHRLFRFDEVREEDEDEVAGLHRMLESGENQQPVEHKCPVCRGDTSVVAVCVAQSYYPGSGAARAPICVD